MAARACSSVAGSASFSCDVGVGAYNDVHDASQRAVKIKEEYMPNTDNFEAYDKAYEKFAKVYEALDSRVF